MVNRQQLLAAIAHGALCGKQIFGRGFVSDERIGGDIPQRIDGPGSSIIAADQAAAFVRGYFTRMAKDFVDVGLLERDDHDVKGMFLRLRRLMCGKALPFRRALTTRARLCLVIWGVAPEIFLKRLSERRSLSAHRAAQPQRKGFLVLHDPQMQLR